MSNSIKAKNYTEKEYAEKFLNFKQLGFKEHRVIEQINEVTIALEEANRVLDPDGRLMAINQIYTLEKSQKRIRAEIEDLEKYFSNYNKNFKETNQWKKYK